MNLKLKPILNSLKQELKQLYGDRLVQLTLFGSQARGDQKLDSDIDILVVLRSQNVHTTESQINVGEEIKRTGTIVADEQQVLLLKAQQSLAAAKLLLANF
jgi:predicted nucleotidyltransferase